MRRKRGDRGVQGTKGNVRFKIEEEVRKGGKRNERCNRKEWM